MTSFSTAPRPNNEGKQWTGTVVGGGLVAILMCAWGLAACDSDDDDGSDTTDGADDSEGSADDPEPSDAGCHGSDAGDLPDCEESCVESLAAGCPNGPPSQAECEAQCESFMAGPCAEQYDLLRECGGSMPELTCDGDGRVAIVGCEQEMTDFVACLNR